MDNIKEHIRRPVRVTRYAFRKMNGYAEAISAIAGNPLEIMGVMLGEETGCGLVATEVIIPEYQKVNPHHARTSGRYIARMYGEAISRDVKVVGMWHSHAAHENFHSEYDYGQLRNIIVRNSGSWPSTIRAEGVQLPYASSVVINECSYLRPDPCLDPIESRNYFCCAGALDGDIAVYADDLDMRLVDPDGRVDHLSLRQEVESTVEYRRRSGEGLYGILERLIFSWGG